MFNNQRSTLNVQLALEHREGLYHKATRRSTKPHKGEFIFAKLCDPLWSFALLDLIEAGYVTKPREGAQSHTKAIHLCETLRFFVALCVIGFN